MSKRNPQPARAGKPGVSGANEAVLVQAVQQAWAWYSANQWTQAEQACRLVLGARPDHFDALNLLGVIAAQTGRAGEAAELLGRAVAQRRDDPAVHNNYGNVLRDLKRHEDALKSYERATKLKPNYAEGYYNRGLVQQDLKRFGDALKCYDRAISLKPDYTAAYNNRGVTLRELKRPDEALKSYTQAIEVNPDHAGAHNNRGIVLQDLRRFAEALVSHDRALALNPNFLEALDGRGNALRNLNRYDDALACFERALKLDPQHAESHNGHGAALYALQRPQDALASYERALALKPDFAEAHYNCASVLVDLQRIDLAEVAYERAIALKPDYPEAHFGRGTLMCDLSRFDEARASFERARAIDPDLLWLDGLWLHARMRLCDWSGLEQDIAAMLAKVGRSERVTTPFSMIPLTGSGALLRKACETWGALCCPPLDTLPPVAKRPRRERIRVGYYSADYYMHATTNLAAELFEKHDRTRFEIVAFDFGPNQPDQMTQRLKAAFDRFIDVRSMSDQQVAQLSRDLEIDIAVDLKGFTQHQRSPIFAYRAAPVQVNYLGFPGTLGSPYMDYIIADPTLIPSASRHLYSEKVAYLPDSYQVNDRSRQIAPIQCSREELGLPPSGFVFCSFNSAYKILPGTFASWMRILEAVAGSVLWLLEHNPVASQNLRRSAASAGVDPSRLVFANLLPLPEHLSRYRVADLFLDTLPCNAHTTASDALWAGLPVLTQTDEAFATRVAASLVNAVGLSELVTTTAADYEQLAVELANQPQRLAEIKSRLARDRLTAPLFDSARYTKHLEDAYSQMYERMQAGEVPEHLYVSR
jgi:protein O-GlcNAc transferase